MQANLMLLLAAAIWGLGFVAQRFGMDHLGPYSFNALRFFIGALSLVPLIWWYNRKGLLQELDWKLLLWGAIPVGVLLFIAASLQQVGLLYTTAANAGFITGLYIVLVPLLGIFLKHKISANIWLGCSIAVAGLYLLSVGEDFSVNFGDLLQLIGAFFWAAHLLTIDHYSKKVPPLLLACLQFVICGVLSTLVAYSIETPELSNALLAWKSVLYSGVVSVGIAYTLQVMAQKHAHPAHAAIILSLETVFAAIGGVWMLGEDLNSRALTGCGLMLLGMLVSQLPLRWLLRSKAFYLMTKQQLEQHYLALWQQSLRKFEQHQFETDPLLTAQDDRRYGVTLLARPSEQVKQQIQHNLAELMLLEPEQYYYPASDLHLTVLSLISCYAGFTLAQIDTAAYVELVKQVIQNTGPFRLHFQGITASPSCVLVQGFFDDQQLNQLRDQLRSAFQLSTLQHSIDQRYAIQTAHMTVLRFSRQPAHPELFLRKIKALASVDFGSCLIDELELVGNDWYQRQENTVLIKRLRLG